MRAVVFKRSLPIADPEALVRRIIESGILPQGSLQLICGRPQDLLAQLTIHDSVAI